MVSRVVPYDITVGDSTFPTAPCNAKKCQAPRLWLVQLLVSALLRVCEDGKKVSASALGQSQKVRLLLKCLIQYSSFNVSWAFDSNVY